MSQNRPNRRNRRQRHTTGNPQRSLPGTPHPNAERPFLQQPIRQESSGSSPPVIPDPIVRTLPTIPRINQANRSEAFYPSIERPLPIPNHQTQVPAWSINEGTSGSEEAHRIPGQEQELHCYHPERIYVSSVIPTRTLRELRDFHAHCQQQFNNYGRTDIVFDHPLSQALEITTSALHFQGLLWRNRIRVTSAGIAEDYCWIRRRARATSIDRAVLHPAYTVTYPWNSEGWIVTRSTHPPFE